MGKVIEKHFPTDPFEALPESLLERALQHLTFKDALRITEVSRKWYEATAVMDSFVNRIKIVTRCGNGARGNTRKEICSIENETLMTSSFIATSLRKYDTLKIRRCSVCINNIHQLLMLHQKWTKVEIVQSQFWNLPLLRHFLHMISENVETLILDDVSFDAIYSNTLNPIVWSFPRMTSLKLDRFPSGSIRHAFVNVHTLKDLCVVYHSKDSTPSSALAELLNANPLLEKLTLEGKIACDLMLHLKRRNLVGSFAFKLTELTINFGRKIKGYFDWSETFAEFLTSQGENLKVLKLKNSLGVEVLRATFALPEVTHLTLGADLPTHYVGNWLEFKFPPNKNIQHLELIDIIKSNFAIVFVSTTPNITSLHVNIMDNYLIKHVSETNKNLQHLSGEDSTVGAPTILQNDLIPSLKTLTFLKFTWTAMHKIREMDEADRNNFQKLYFAL